jgi:hypothetical protein
MTVKRSFHQRMRAFEDALIAMSALAQRSTREEWMGTPKDDRDICLKALADLTEGWTESPDDLMKLQKLSEGCVEHYEKGDFDAGDFAVKDIVEFLYNVRERAKKSITKKRPE